MLNEQFVSIGDRTEQLERAAWNAGHAGAMIANLYTAGQHERATSWEAERAAWYVRRDDLIKSLPFGHEQAIRMAESVAALAFQSNVIQLKSVAN